MQGIREQRQATRQHTPHYLSYRDQQVERDRKNKPTLAPFCVGFDVVMMVMTHYGKVQGSKFKVQS